MEKRINPFSDFGFKRIFGKESRKSLLIDFLNSLLKGERNITNLRYLDKEQVKRSVEERTVIYDIFCETDDGEKIIVEMQNCSQSSFINRSIFYLSTAIAEQGEPGPEWDYDISAVYCISLLNHEPDDMPRKFRTDVMLMDKDTHYLFSDKVKLVYLQIPLFRKKEEECVTELDKWIYNLKHMKELTQLPFALKGNAFQILEEVTDLDSLTKEERREYEHSLKVYRDLQGAMLGERKLGARQEHEKMAKQEHEKMLKIAGYMKSIGVSMNDIKENTGLTEEEIQSL